MRVTCGTWRAWAALAVALAACGPARAFYWPDWPGSRLQVQQTLVPNPRTQEPIQPLPTIPAKDAPPPIGPQGPGDRPPVGPHPTPEPSTALIGLIGLGALAAARRWRTKK